MDLCDVSGAILGFGVNQFAKRVGLSELPAGVGKAIDWDPGFFAKNEMASQCHGDDSDSLIYNLNLDTLSDVTNNYIQDRMLSLANTNMYGADAEATFETPQVGLTYIGLPGKMSALLWLDPNKPGAEKIQGVILKWQYNP